MKLFTLGPVPMYPETLAAASRQIPYFRTPEFSQTVLQSEEILLRLAAAEKGA
jgi:aspartate aminotransferase-like enzyme